MSKLIQMLDIFIWLPHFSCTPCTPNWMWLKFSNLLRFYRLWTVIGGNMAGPLLGSCCYCQSLRNGSIVSGLLAIILSIATIIVIYTTRVTFKTIVFDWLPTEVVRIILVINLCMTILISTFMIAGVVKVLNKQQLLQRNYPFFHLDVISMHLFPLFVL